MHGVMKPVTMENPRGKQEKAGLNVNGTLNRMDFGVGKSGSAVVSEDVEIKKNGEFARQDASVAEKK